MRGLILLTFLLFTLFKSQYSSTWHNTDNDLPQSSIKDIIKDKYGFIWLGTDHGLVKYDGLNFTVFDEFPVSNLLFDNFLGNIENDSIIVYNNYEKEKILIRGRIPKVYTAKNNNNYKLLSKRNGVYLKRIVKNDLVNSYQSNTQYFIKLKSGSYTFGKNSIIYTQRNKSVTISIPFANNYLDNIFVKDDILYITDPKKNKVYAITKGRLNILRGPDLLKDPDTRIYWHQTTGQTLFINKMNIYILVKEHGENKIRFLANYRELLNYPINALYYDENFNKLFIGTTNNGLNILDPDQFYITRDNTPFANNIFHATVPFNKNTIITENGLEFNKSGIKKKYPFGKHGKDFMFYDSKKNIVFPDKAYIIRIKRKYHYQKADSLYINPDLDKVFASNGLYSYSTTDFIKNNFLYIFKNDEFKKTRLYLQI
ncbi:two-component regulator propeller domain-containing protein [Chryseobacterium gossypii]|uniref:two-component regulator propeller domain-containing protein n=1 Tax=Chryseobacterium gossypii TaxID=3231602 RepID=UPI003525E0E7